MRQAFARVRRPIKCLAHDCTKQDQLLLFLPFLIREKARWKIGREPNDYGRKRITAAFLWPRWWMGITERNREDLRPELVQPGRGQCAWKAEQTQGRYVRVLRLAKACQVFSVRVL